MSFQTMNPILWKIQRIREDHKEEEEGQTVPESIKDKQNSKDESNSSWVNIKA